MFTIVRIINEHQKGSKYRPCNRLIKKIINRNESRSFGAYQLLKSAFKQKYGNKLEQLLLSIKTTKSFFETQSNVQENEHGMDHAILL